MEKRGKSKRIETLLPEAMIHHIQSFMSGKEAARTTILSKSWYDAWLTRPSLDFNQSDFKLQYRHPLKFAEFTTKTIQRYKHLNLKIDTFTLQTDVGGQISDKYFGINHFSLVNKLILAAMEIGATHLNLHLCSSFRLPQQLLRSQTLVRLSVKGCQIHDNINCPMLKSLTLERMTLANDDIIRDVIVSIEELSLSNSSYSQSGKPLALSWMNHYKLTRLYLETVEVDNSFFDTFDSRFPCLKYLSLVRCKGYKGIHICSTSLTRISIVQQTKALRAKFDVPNLATFSYSGTRIPSLAFKPRLQWESNISIHCHYPHTSAWYRKLHKLLIRLSSSRTNLSIKFSIGMNWRRIGDDLDDEYPSKSVVVVESLTIEAPFDLSWKLLVGFFWICNPKFVTHYWLPRDCCKYWMENNHSLQKLHDKLLQEVIADDGEENIIDQLLQEVIADNGEENILRRLFGVKEVNVEVYEEINVTEWRPLFVKKPLDALTDPPNKRKVRFGLKWA